MSFEPRFSLASSRLSETRTDLWKVHSDALQRQAQGDDIIMMSVGDPDLRTIVRIIEHAVTSLYRGRTHYSPGMGELHLRQTIADIETRASGRLTSSDEIIIFPGATNAIFSVLTCLLDSDDELIVTEPAYVGYQGIFQAIGANIISVPANVDNGFTLDSDAIERVISSKTKVLLLNTPGNPAGNMIPADQLASLARLCLEKNIWLVCDEVYSMITFEQKHISARTAAKNLENIIVIDGLSKSHAMTGWRLGWAVAPVNVVEKLLNFTSATIFGCSQFIQDAAAFAMQNDGDYIQSITAKYKARRDYACERIRQINGLRCNKPQAGMFLMVDVSEISEDGQAFASSLLNEQGVSVLPGEGFGKITRNFVRLSLTHPTEDLQAAFDRIENFVNSNR
ncbi:MAG: aspartate aminotransferase [Gammaproteobacteria bacterium]|jgi:arginine:pyruvate transaminase|nr:aspartate aminotransferase [Gammaproteobacteria bacterium]|tara:strand:+ start:75 stop:1259 length:1185 start_codon:yes stop_codon:yes gene_type:complete